MILISEKQKEGKMSDYKDETEKQKWRSGKRDRGREGYKETEGERATADF